MTDYKELYFDLFAKVSDAIDLLIKVQQDCENKVIEDTDIKKAPDS